MRSNHIIGREEVFVVVVYFHDSCHEPREPEVGLSEIMHLVICARRLRLRHSLYLSHFESSTRRKLLRRSIHASCVSRTMIWKPRFRLIGIVFVTCSEKLSHPHAFCSSVKVAPRYGDGKVSAQVQFRDWEVVADSLLCSCRKNRIDVSKLSG